MTDRRITFAVQVANKPKAQALLLAISSSYNDGMSFVGIPTWEDANSNPYHVSSSPRSDAWITALEDTLTRPAWDVNEDIDMVAAQAGQDILTVWEYDENGTPPTATPSNIVAIIYDTSLDALGMMGLEVIETAP